MKNYLQRNKYSEVNITVHEHGLHGEMKTSTDNFPACLLMDRAMEY